METPHVHVVLSETFDEVFRGNDGGHTLTRCKWAILVIATFIPSIQKKKVLSDQD